MAAIGVIFLLLLLLTPFQLAAADVFCDNIKAVASILSKNASSSPVHFASTTYGQAPNAVYALALCGGDILDGSTCGTCITNWFDTALSLAQCAKVGSNYGGSIIAYGGASSNILAAPSNATGGSGDNMPPFQDWNPRNVSGGNVTLIAALTHELLAATAEKAAVTVPSRYATGVMDMERVSPTYPSCTRRHGARRTCPPTSARRACAVSSAW